MTKILSYCNTPLQLMNILNIIFTDYSDCDIDIIITDRISNVEKLINSIDRNYVNNIHLVNTDKYIRIGGFHKSRILKFLDFFFYSFRYKYFFPGFKRDYDLFLFSNFDQFSNLIALNNKKAKKYWVEDGTASYVSQGHYWVNTSKTTKLYYSVFRKNYLYESVDMQYLYKPELAEYCVPFQRRKISSIVPGSYIARMILAFFGFKLSKNIHEKYIYFDGPWKTDNINEGNDTVLLDSVVNIIGIDNIVIKVHPRANVDDYLRKGYKVFPETYYPWELYCLHEIFLSDKVLISIMSTSIVSPFLYTNNPKSVISLIELFDLSKLPISFQQGCSFIRDRIYKRYPDVFKLPKTLSDFTDLVKDTF